MTAVRDGDGYGEPPSVPLSLLPHSRSVHFYFVTRTFRFEQRSRFCIGAAPLLQNIDEEKSYNVFFSNFFSQPFFIGAATAKYEFNPQFRSEGLFYCGTECRLLCAMEFSVLGKNYAQDFS